MNNHLAADTQSLESLFGIEIENGAMETAAVADTWGKIKCRKCNGSGNFVGYTGRIVGKCFTCKGEGVVMRTDAPDAPAIDVSKIETAFAAAMQNGIKRPKLRLDSFRFSRAPDAGKNAGSIYVKQGETYLGKVTAGRFICTRECGAECEAQVIAVAADPAKAAKVHGLRTGECSCCGRELTNKESIDLGIGPICAEKYGWA